MVGADAEGQAAVDDVLAQTEGEADDAFVGALIVDGIVVERASHARDGRIEARAVLLPHDLLDDDGHLLLVDDVARGLHVGFRVLEVDRSIDALDGIRKHEEHPAAVVEIGHHISVVDTGKRLVVAVFEERT